MAINYVNHAISSGPNFGKGHGPINHLNTFIIKNLNEKRCSSRFSMGRWGKRQDSRLAIREADIVIRFQGGHNAGHTLVIDGITYKLRLLPSGIVRKNKVSIIGNGVVVDPWALLDEIEEVKSKGVKIN